MHTEPQSALAIAAIEALLAKMFNTSPRFCVIDFDHLARLAGVSVSREERDALAAFHCINYSDMGNGVKQMLASKVIEILRRSPEWRLEIKVILQQPIRTTTNLLT